MLKTHKFARKPFYVDAVRVTEGNMEEVAKWCQGEIKTEGDAGRAEEETRYISVKVHRPLTDRQTQAFVGDWVLFAGSGFKVYTPKAFDKSFEKVKTLTKAQADAAGIRPPIEKKKSAKKGIMEVGRAVREANEIKQAEKQSDVDYRDAKSGQYVTEEYAEENPDTTVAERDIRKEQEEFAAQKQDDEAEQLIQEVLSEKLPSDKS